MIDPAEFVNNPTWCIVTGKDEFGLQHIARLVDGKLLCGVRIKNTGANLFDLFSSAYLCRKCEAKYLSGS